MKAGPKEQASTEEVDVTQEDQNYINEFSRIYSKNKLIDAEIKKLNDILESLSDAGTAVDENFGAMKVKLSIGESFVETTDEQAKEYVEKMQQKYTTEKVAIIDKYEKNKKRLDELKIILYSKFGKRLRLEED